MMNNRINVTKEMITLDVVIVEIDSTLTEIYRIFSHAFSEGQLKPSGAAAHHAQVFNEIWEQLDRSISGMPTLEGLQKVYETIDVNSYIRNFCEELNLSEEIFLKKIKSLLVEAVKIHCALNRQRMLLSQLKQMDALERIDNSIKKIADVNESAKKKIYSLKSGEIESEMMSIYKLTCFILHMLVNIKYINKNELTIDIDAINSERFFPHELEEVQSQLQSLLVSDQLNSITGHLKESVEKSDKQKIVKYQKELVDAIQLIDDVQGKLMQIVSAKIDNLDKTLSKTVDDSETIRNSLSSLELKSLAKIFRVVLQINGYKMNVNDADMTDIKGYGELRDLAYDLDLICKNQTAMSQKKNDGFFFGLSSIVWKESDTKDGVWQTAANDVGRLLVNRANTIEKFLQPYNHHYIQAKAVQEQIDVFHEKLRVANLRQTQLAAQLSKAKNIWSECDKIFDNAKAILLRHIQLIPEKNSEYIRSFLLRHWGKILVGSSGGAGLTTLLCILASINPGIIALGALIGGSTGAISGVGMDHLSKKSGSDHLQDETTPLLSKKKKQSADFESPTNPDMQDPFSDQILKEEGRLDNLLISPYLIYQSKRSSGWLPNWAYFWSSTKPDSSDEVVSQRNNKRYL